MIAEGSPIPSAGSRGHSPAAEQHADRDAAGNGVVSESLEEEDKVGAGAGAGARPEQPQAPTNGAATESLEEEDWFAAGARQQQPQASTPTADFETLARLALLGGEAEGRKRCV